MGDPMSVYLVPLSSYAIIQTVVGNLVNEQRTFQLPTHRMVVQPSHNVVI